MLTVTLFSSNEIEHIQAEDEETVVVNDIEWQVEENTSDSVELSTNDDEGYTYEAVYDKEEDNIRIVCEEDGLFWDKEVYDYIVQVLNYIPDDNVLEYELTDNNTNETIHIDESELNEQLPFAIVGGIALGDIIAGLLGTAAVIYVGSKAYAAAKDVVSELKRKGKNIYRAYISNKTVYIGDAFSSTSDAVSHAKHNKKSKENGIFCFGSGSISGAYMSVVLSSAASPVGRAIADNAHKDSEGYYYHTHPAKSKSGGDHYALHVWYE